MHSFKTLSVLAMAATTVFAAPAPAPAAAAENAIEARGPQWGNWRGAGRWYYRPAAGETITVGGWGGQPIPTGEPATPTETAQPEITSTPSSNGNWGGNWGGWTGSSTNTGSSGWSSASEASSAPASTSTGTVSTGGDWFSIANTWRAATGKPAFTLSQQLVANAQDTADSSGGQLIHKLNPGSFAQVLAPGDSSDFESVYVGGWLCELPDTPGLNGICATEAQGWNHAGQTGHAEILLGSYTNIGCALGDGIWACDFS